MQRLYNIGFPSDEHIPALKKLWADVFKDGEEVIDNFFENTQTNSNTVCAFCDGVPVSMLFAVESEIFYGGNTYKAYYVYAVCTHPEHRGQALMSKTMSFLEAVAKERGFSYLYLVPASESLFSLYSALGYKTAFSYSEIVVKAPELPVEQGFSFGVDYAFYKSLRTAQNDSPIVVWSEAGFAGFVPQSMTADSFAITVKDKGYAVVEKIDGKFLVQELFGDEKSVLEQVFAVTKDDSIMLRKATKNVGVPLGMLKALDNSPYFENGFIGSYGG